MTSSRKKNTKRNIIVSYLYTGIGMLFQFVSRTIIIKFLGDDYLGLSSLFTSILQVLNMAEMGFAGAIVYNMYKPLADGDKDTVCALLLFYKKIYRIVGMIVLFSGVIITPIIPLLIKGDYPSTINIYILYLLYLANTVVSYFLFAYKTSLLEAMQRMDLEKMAYTIVTVVQYLLQIISIAVFKNYYLFVVAMIIGSAARNIAASIFSKKYFPEYKCQGELPEEIKKDVISRVKGLLVCNISGVTYTTFDSIILSACVGLAPVAIYNNYVTIFTGVTTVIALIRNAMQASVGNSVAKETKEKNYEDMLLWQFFFSVIASWCVACMLSLYQPFMELWMGKERLLPMEDVVLICIWFNVTIVQHAYFLYLSGNGLWWELRWPYIGSTVCNILLNIILGKYFGITGVIFSTVFVTTVVGLIWQCTVIFKCYYEKSSLGYLFKQFYYMVISGVVAIITYFTCSFIKYDGFMGILLKALICLVLPTIILVIVYWRSDISKRAVAFLKEALKA